MTHTIVAVSRGSDLTLADLKATQEGPSRERLIERWALSKSISELNKHFPFFERLNKTSDNILRSLPLSDLQQAWKKSVTKLEVIDALIEEEALIEIPLHELEERGNLKFLSFRIQEIRQNRPDLMARLSQKTWREQPLQLLATKMGLLPQEDPAQMSAVKLGLLSGQEILSIKDQLPLQAFGLLTDDQIKNLDFSQLSNDQILSCIRREPSSLSRIHEKLFTKQILALNLDDFTDSQIREIFLNVGLSEDERKARIAILPSSSIRKILGREINIWKYLPVESTS